MEEHISKTSSPNESEENKCRTIKTNAFLIQRDTEEQRKISYWENRWASGATLWHKKDHINPFLLKHFTILLISEFLI